MRIFIGFCFIVLFFLMGFITNKIHDRNVKKYETQVFSFVKLTNEIAYWKGQKDALNKDIRIDILNKEWVKPWDNDSIYYYNPKLSLVENIKQMKNGVTYKNFHKKD